MTKVKRFGLALLGLLATVFTVSGCSDAAQDRQYEGDFHLHDGRTVHCLLLSYQKGDSITCDWQHAK